MRLGLGLVDDHVVQRAAALVPDVRAHGARVARQQGVAAQCADVAAGVVLRVACGGGLAFEGRRGRGQLLARVQHAVHHEAVDTADDVRHGVPATRLGHGAGVDRRQDVHARLLHAGAC
ncbi:MAG: hypothetical protein ACK5QX_00470 [bacterium]